MKFLQRITRAVLACVLVSALWACADTQPDLTGVEARADMPRDEAVALSIKAGEQGDKAALKVLMAAAQKGSPHAQVQMGNLSTGNQRTRWYLKAMEQGDLGGEIAVGAECRYDWAVASYRQVVQEFLPAWRKAAEQGNALAQKNLGVLYGKGCGVARDYGQAIGWYRKAAEQGNDRAQANLAKLYYFGEGVSRNKAVGYALFNLACWNYDPTSIGTYRWTESEMTPQEIKDGQALADKMRVPGNVLKALDEYLAAHPSSDQSDAGQCQIQSIQ